MWPMLTGLITGGASLIGSMFSANQSGENTQANIAAQRASQEDSQAFNAEQAFLQREFGSHEAAVNRQFQAEALDTNRQFQMQMSNSAYQRSMQDMRAAGLNPILAAGAGGASTPSGGTASGSQPSGAAASSSPVNMAHHNTVSPMAGLGDAVGKAVSSAVQAKTFEKMTDEISNIQADTAKTKAMEKLVDQQKATEEKETTRRANVSDSSHYQLSKDRLTSEEAQAILSMPKWLRDTLQQGAYSGKKVDDTLSAIPGLAHSARSIRHTFSERFRGGY